MTREEIINEFDRLHDNLMSVARDVKTDCNYVCVPFGFPVVIAKYSVKEDRFVSLRYHVGVGKPSFPFNNSGYFDEAKEVVINLKEVEK